MLSWRKILKISSSFKMLHKIYLQILNIIKNEVSFTLNIANYTWKFMYSLKKTIKLKKTKRIVTTSKSIKKWAGTVTHSTKINPHKSSIVENTLVTSFSLDLITTFGRRCPGHSQIRPPPPTSQHYHQNCPF